MAHLSLSLLGSFRVTLDGRPVTAFESDKARALLAYLAVNGQHPYSRDALAGMFWPERPGMVARSSLREALYSVRTALHDQHARLPFLLTTASAIQFNRQSDHELDVARFEGALRAAASAQALEAALAIYSGDFLVGLSIADSIPFQEWVVARQEHLHGLALAALVDLAECYERENDYLGAVGAVRRQLELEPWREEAHRELMRLLARLGERSTALHQYEICRRILAREFGVAPSHATVAVYEKIRGDGLAPLS